MFQILILIVRRLFRTRERVSPELDIELEPEDPF